MNLYSVTIGFRSLFWRKRQYVSLFAVCIVGTAISLFSMFLIRGMMTSLTQKAKIYYGGSLQFLGGDRNLYITNAAQTIAALKRIFPQNAVISARSELDAKDCALYFEGTGVRQRVIKGIDFTVEQRLFDGFSYVAGSARDMAGSDGVLLSEPIARMLGAACGDVITFMLYTVDGYRNTVPLTVQGIFRDSSLFGMYTSYLDIDCLRRACGKPQNTADRIGIFFPDREPDMREIQRYQAALENEFPMYPLVKDKHLFYDKLLGGELAQTTYALIPLSANIQEVQIIVAAIYSIAAFVIAALVVIIIVGIGSTYRVLVMKRINEIGIYMAIGMKKRGILAVFSAEALLLLVCGCCGGIGLSLLLSKSAELFDLSFIPAFDIFLTGGHLKPLPGIADCCNFTALVVLTTMAAVLYAVWKSVRISPVEALGVTE